MIMNTAVKFTVMTTVFDGRTSDNDFGLYFDSVSNTPSLVYNDNDNNSFGRKSNTIETAAPVYNTVYTANFNSTFNTKTNTAFHDTQAIASTSHAFPYYDIDSSLPSIYHGESSTGNNERSSVTVTTKTYELLQATFILILTSIILLIVLIHISILSFG